MDIYTHLVYWIHLPEHTDVAKEGYVGVTNDLQRRLHEHINSSSKTIDKNPYFTRSLRKHKPRIIQTILLVDTENNCYKYEEALRPYKNIGWNANKGGNKPPSRMGWSPNQKTREKRSVSLKGIPRNNEWKKNLSESKKGSKNGMYGKKNPCSHDRRIQTIRTKSQEKLEQIKLVFELLGQNKRIRDIKEITKISTSTICKMKKEKSLYFEAFPILKQFDTC